MTDQDLTHDIDDPWEFVAATFALSMSVAQFLVSETGAPIFEVASRQLEAMCEAEGLPAELKRAAFNSLQRTKAAEAKPDLTVAKAPLLGPNGRPL